MKPNRRGGGNLEFHEERYPRQEHWHIIVQGAHYDQHYRNQYLQEQTEKVRCFNMKTSIGAIAKIAAAGLIKTVKFLVVAADKAIVRRLNQRQ